MNEELEVSNRILTSRFQNQLRASPRGRDGPLFSDDSERAYPADSFETHLFDIYDPNYSCDSSFGDHLERLGGIRLPEESLASDLVFSPPSGRSSYGISAGGSLRGEFQML